MAAGNVGCSILANRFPISSLSSFKPLGGCHLVPLIKVHLFNQFDLDELGCCPELDLVSSFLFLENPKSVWISLIFFSLQFVTYFYCICCYSCSNFFLLFPISTQPPPPPSLSQSTYCVHVHGLCANVLWLIPPPSIMLSPPCPRAHTHLSVSCRSV